MVNSHWERRTIKKVLFIPDLRKNLFSVGQAADKGFTTTYTKHSCYLTSQGEHGRKVLTGTRSNKLYLLDMQVIMPESHANAVLAEVPMEEVKRVQHEPGKYVRLWHKRFGHVHNVMIMHMHNYNMVNGLELGSHDLPTSPCEGCAMGKNSCKTLPKETLTPRADKPGKFFHSDVCGPMSQESYGGARYFVLFKDDCSGYRIVYCVKQKSQVLECFKKLQAFVKQETGNEIQKLRSDRGGEYMSKEFQEYLVTQSICHEVTCPYTPEQNGAAERENRTLMESARSMLHDKKLNL